ncbi:MAG TPA: hypothetical protein RMH85_04405 [Polyangiaceae bacterium LLY-WYZ-15_(1-7)]|nr:hypothetical protein [Sandaracinus sp.]HJL02868.1 hypothetical protein [Polyangiaceae bacterium LLY-WYZ-15_(1-7)]HJL07711.1 hypothetical protein [Polyangiaceae bacterium LLY-WYZ-15_(1-7)]HJL23182.1 hypothetical protein [Polyangiaceae bacterium LLY-WYZ-15_(1-7)]HJL32615.1 hypothetical protein [Polyangiaceae bacterium LLY-WYZ-15_(1-7)]
MTQILAGATLERPPGPKYVASLPYAELTFPSSWPKLATLAKWRKTAPGLELGVVAPYGVRTGEKGALRFDEGLEERFAWYLNALGALRGHAVVPTGSELSTSKRDRERLAAYFERLKADDPERLIVWAPTGIWSRELAHPFAAEQGVVCAYDPLLDFPPEGPVGYARLKAMGERQRFSEGVLFDLLDRLEDAGFEKAYVALESERSFREASQLQQLAAAGE